MNENKYGFIPSVPKDGDFIHGDGLLGTVAINPSGQWDLWLPQDEFQNRGYETFCCVSEATLHCTEILQRKKYTDPTQYAVRFLATMSGTGQKQGNDNNTVAETLRKGGCCQETDWPFGAVDYNAFYTAPSANIISLAQYQFRDDSFGHSWITDTSPAGMKNALTFSPLALSVYAWPLPDAQGIYHRPAGAQDVHCITVYGYEDGVAWHIFDSYDKTHKRLAWDYGFGIGKRFTLDRRIPTSPTQPIEGLAWVNWGVWMDAVRRWLHIGEYSAERTLGAQRSPQWSAFKRQLEKTVPKICAICGTDKGCQLHHKTPFSRDPSRELDPTNVVWLCEQGEHSCHLIFGHLYSFFSYNTDLDNTIAEWNTKITNRPAHLS